jgi:hypothetical protein
MLELERDRHRGEQHRPHEDVVDAQRLLDQVAADVLAERLTAERGGNDAGKGESARHPDDRLVQRLAHRRLVIDAMTDEVDGEHHADHGDEHGPRPKRYGEVDKLRTS